MIKNFKLGLIFGSRLYSQSYLWWSLSIYFFSVFWQANPLFADDGDRTESPRIILQEGALLENFPLKSTKTSVQIVDTIAKVNIEQTYANNGDETINALYVFPSSTRAAIYKMQMQIGERIIKAKIKEKGVARRTFESAKKAGKKASLISQQRPNVFQMEVANVLPGDTVKINFSYTELLVPLDGTYEFVYPTVVGPRYSDEPQGELNASSSRNWTNNPYLNNNKPKEELSFAASIKSSIPIASIASPSHRLATHFVDKQNASITLTESHSSNRDLIVKYRLLGETIQTGALISSGSKDHNYFSLMLAPPERVSTGAVVSREYIFIVDVSGSMHGFPLDTTKNLMKRLLSKLSEQDSFNLVLFAGTSGLYSPSSLPATSVNIEKSINFLNSHQGAGGTNLLPALAQALAIPESERSRTLVVVTDGYVTVEDKSYRLIRENLGKANLFAFGIGSSVNRNLIEIIARAGYGEPFIVTDPSKAEAVANKFHKHLLNPLLTDIKVAFGDIEITEMEPPQLPDLFASSPIVIKGKWQGDLATATVTISGKQNGREYRKVHNLSKLMLPNQEGGDLLPVLWARSRIETP